MNGTHVVSQHEWLEPRLDLLAKEKALDKQRDELTRPRQAMPWVKVDTAYHGSKPLSSAETSTAKTKEWLLGNCSSSIGRFGLQSTLQV